MSDQKSQTQNISVIESVKIIDYELCNEVYLFVCRFHAKSLLFPQMYNERIL